MKLFKTILICISFLFVYNCNYKTDLENCEAKLEIERTKVLNCKNANEIHNNDSSRNLESDSLMLTGSFIIDDNLRYQIIYNSQNYNTYYSIFAKFHIDSLNNVYGVDLKLVNYKGPIDIGFYESANNRIKTQIKHENGKLKIIPLVQGLSKIKDYNKNNPNNFIEIPPIPKSKISEIIVLRKLFPLNFDATLSQIKGHTKGYVFDEEFFYRDGIGSPPDTIKRRSGHYNTKLTFKDQNEIMPSFFNELDTILNELPKGISGKCYSSRLFVYHR